jgi:hypothetical protein
MTLTAACAQATLSFQGCFSVRGEHGCEAPEHQSLHSAWDVVVSPDGTSVYVGSYGDHAISAFDRAPDGSLDDAGCLADQGYRGCENLPHDSLFGPQGLAISPDGTSLYAGSDFAASVTTFDRALDGSLTQAGCIANGGIHGCQAPPDGHNSLDGGRDVAISPDGQSVYQVGYGDTITGFMRASDGTLTYQGCISSYAQHGCEVAGHPLLGPHSVIVSPDGDTVYVGTFYEVAEFDRSADGSLSYAGCIGKPRYGCINGGKPRLIAWDLAISPDGDSVYARRWPGRRLTEAIVELARAPDGSLSRAGCIGHKVEGCARAPKGVLRSLDGDLEVAPDGQSLWVGALRTVTRLERAADGSLSFGECISDRGQDAPGACASTGRRSISDPRDLAIGPDGSSAYITGFGADSVTAVTR